MYVSTFPGLAASALLRPADRRPRRYPFDAPHQRRFYRARNAIFHLFQALVATKPTLAVLVPDYNSGNEVLALRAAGATIHYCPVGPDARLDPDDVERLCEVHGVDVLYVIHYLGWPQPMAELAALCRRRGLLLVEDCALALLSEADHRPLGTFGDWSVFCLYKTLPVPNGALLVQNTSPLDALERLRFRRASVASVAGRTTELLVQRLRTRLNGVGAVLHAVKRTAGRAAGALDVPRARVGDIGFERADVDLAMSRVSERLLDRLDFEDIRQRRIRNFADLAERLDGTVSLLCRETAGGICPLFLPVLVDDKAAAAQSLRRQGIEALEFWNADGDGAATSGAQPARFLRAHVLGLPIHQDLTPRHVAFIGDQVSRLAPCLSLQ